MRGKLPSAAQRLAHLRGEAQHDFARRHAQCQHHGKVAVVDIELVRAAPQGVHAANLRRLVTLRGRHDSRLALAIQHPDALVQRA